MIQEFKNLHTTLAQHQRMHDSYAKDVEAKDNLIKRLKSIKESLENEVDGLRQELLKVKEESDRYAKERHIDNTEVDLEQKQGEIWVFAVLHTIKGFYFKMNISGGKLCC